MTALVIPLFERCEVKCSCCGARYDTVEYEDEIPLFCEVCFTPSLQVIERESVEYTPKWQ